MTQVAARTGQAVAAVLDQPYGLTLWSFVQFQDADRIARVQATKDRLDLARYMAFAMWQPATLEKIERAELGPSGAPGGLAEREARLMQRARPAIAPSPEGST